MSIRDGGATIYPLIVECTVERSGAQEIRNSTLLTVQNHLYLEYRCKHCSFSRMTTVKFVGRYDMYKK